MPGTRPGMTRAEVIAALVAGIHEQGRAVILHALFALP
jgi:hypothetical protein